jgi:kumamolisin
VPAAGRTVTVDNVDGGPGAPSDKSGSGETDLDVEQSGGLTPGASIIVYQAPNTGPGFIDVSFSAASQNVVDTLSSSWGESETIVAAAVAAGQETITYQVAFDEVFPELADQGPLSQASSSNDNIFCTGNPGGLYDAVTGLGTPEPRQVRHRPRRTVRAA